MPSSIKSTETLDQIDETSVAVVDVAVDDNDEAASATDTLPRRKSSTADDMTTTVAALTDTDETLRAVVSLGGGGGGDTGSEHDEVFVEANESQEPPPPPPPSHFGSSPRMGGGRLRVDSSFGGMSLPPPIALEEEPTPEAKEKDEAKEEEEEESEKLMLFDFGRGEAAEKDMFAFSPIVIDEQPSRAEEEEDISLLDEKPPQSEDVERLPQLGDIEKQQSSAPESIEQQQLSQAEEAEADADADADNLIQLLSSDSSTTGAAIARQALSKPIGDGNGNGNGGGGGGALGRSISLRYGGNKATIDERRRPSLSAGAGAGGAGGAGAGGGVKAANRRSIMLTSFVPPVGLSGGPNSSSSTRSSNDSGRNALGSCDLSSSASSSASASLAEPAALTSIRLRPPSADIIAAPQQQQQQQPSVIKSALASISERAGGDEAGGGGGPPAWVLEVQRRKREALDRKDEDRREADRKDQDRKDQDRREADDTDELPPLAEIDLSPTVAVKENTPPPPVPASPRAYVAPTRASASVYRSLSASLGIGQPAAASPNPAQDHGERQRSTSQASAVASPNPAQPSSGGGLFAAVSSFFGRASTQGSATESAQQMAAMAARLSSSQSSSGNRPEGNNNIAFPGMRPSHSEAVAENNDDDDDDGSRLLLLHQLEAQNAQILGDNKARVFADKAAEPAEAASADDESADWDFWGSLISDYDRVSRASPRKLARAVHAGIPAPIRGTVWQLMSGSRAEAAVVGAVFRRLQQHHEGDGNSDQQRRNEKLIRQDVARTFPRDAFFRDAGGAGQAALFSVLRAYSLYDAEVGYCQGLAFITGPLLLHMPEEDAFCVLVRLMGAYGLRGHFLPAMDDLHLRLFQLDHVLNATLPRLARHLAQQGVRPTMYAAQWLMTLFAYRLPLHLAVRLFDVVLAEGLDALLRVAVAVLKRSQPRLLALADFDAIVHYLNDGPLFAFYAHAAPDTLVRDANQITAVTPRLLQTLRRRYVEETERRLDEEDEAARVKDEAARLKAECEALRKENQLLQNKLKDLPAAPAAQQPPLVRGVDELAQKNVQLAIKNQQLEDSLHDMEAALVQIKVLYAESESDRAVLAMKLDGLRKALT